MINPTRRNRNIGTSKQGHGQDNKLVVPFPAVAMKSFYERLGKYKVVERIINEHVFKFVIEETRLDSYHACTIEDIASILGKIPNEDYGAMELIILRQPTRKEETLKCVWGRLIYSYEFEKEYFPAVIIEAVDLDRKFKWDKKLSVGTPFGVAPFSLHSFCEGDLATSYFCWHLANFRISIIASSQY